MMCLRNDTILSHALYILNSNALAACQHSVPQLCHSLVHYTHVYYARVLCKSSHVHLDYYSKVIGMKEGSYIRI